MARVCILKRITTADAEVPGAAGEEPCVSDIAAASVGGASAQAQVPPSPMHLARRRGSAPKVQPLDVTAIRASTAANHAAVAAETQAWTGRPGRRASALEAAAVAQLGSFSPRNLSPRQLARREHFRSDEGRRGDPSPSRRRGSGAEGHDSSAPSPPWPRRRLSMPDALRGAEPPKPPRSPPSLPQPGPLPPMHPASSSASTSTEANRETMDDFGREPVANLRTAKQLDEDFAKILMRTVPDAIGQSSFSSETSMCHAPREQANNFSEHVLARAEMNDAMHKTCTEESDAKADGEDCAAISQDIRRVQGKIRAVELLRANFLRGNMSKEDWRLRNERAKG